MTPESDRWRDVRAYQLYPKRLARVQGEAGDALATANDALARENAELRADAHVYRMVVADLRRDVEARDRRIAELEAGMGQLADEADRAVLDLSRDAVIGAPFVARIARDLLSRGGGA